MNEKQFQYLLIFVGVFVLSASIYSANAKPTVPADVANLLKRTNPTELDYRFASCYMYYKSKGLPGKDVADYCGSINLGGWVLTNN